MPDTAPHGVPPRRRLPTTAMHSIALKFTVIGLNAVTGIVSARALSPSGRGELAAIIIWPMLLAGVTTIGLPSALVYHLRRDREDAAAIVGWGLLLCTLTTLIGTAIGWYVVPLWLRQQPPSIVLAAQVCLLTTLACSLTLLGRAGWEARSEFSKSNWSQVSVPVFVILGIVTQIALGTLTPVSAAATYALAGFPALAWVLVSLVRTYRPTLRGARDVWRRLLQYGGRSYGVDLCSVLAIYLDQAMVVGLLSAASMGIYAVALNLSRVIGAVHGSVAMMVFPRVVGLAPEAMSRAVARSGRMGTIVGAVMGVAVLISGPSLLQWLYGPAYRPASQILPILVCQVIVAGLVHVLLQGFLAAGRPGVATTIQMTGLLCGVPLFLFLVPRFGVAGAAVALLLSSTLRLILTMASYRSVLGVPMPRVWIDASDLAEFAHYRTALVESVLRLRPAAGEAK